MSEPLKLKELEWEDLGVGFTSQMTLLGEFFINKTGFWWHLERVSGQRGSDIIAKTLEQAKQAAQDHYQKEMMKSLEVNVCKHKVDSGFSETECNHLILRVTTPYIYCPYCGGLIEEVKSE